MTMQAGNGICLEWPKLELVFLERDLKLVFLFMWLSETGSTVNYRTIFREVVAHFLNCQLVK